MAGAGCPILNMTPIGAWPRAGDWLTRHVEDGSGQSFELIFNGLIMSNTGLYVSKERASDFASLQDAKLGMLKRGDFVAHPMEGRTAVGIYVGFSVNRQPWIYYSKDPTMMPSLKSYNYKNECERFDSLQVKANRIVRQFLTLSSMRSGEGSRGELVRLGHGFGLFVGKVRETSTLGNGLWVCWGTRIHNAEFRRMCTEFDKICHIPVADFRRELNVAE